jgi:DNA-binding response OmpR family regulator
VARRVRAGEDVRDLRSNPVASILLCDDERDSADVLARELESLGHDVTIARTCAEAFAAACARDFDVLVAAPFLRDGSTLVLPSALGIRRPRLTVLLSRIGDRLAPAVVRRVGFDTQLTKLVDGRSLDRLVRAVFVTVDVEPAEPPEPVPASEVGARAPR